MAKTQLTYRSGRSKNSNVNNMSTFIPKPLHSSFSFYLILLTSIFFFSLLFPHIAEAACTEPSPGGNYTISSSCVFAGTNNVHGVDNGGMTINGGVTLTVAAGQTIVWGPGQSIIINGSIIINDTGQLKQTRIWMLDSDTDGYPSTTTQVAQDSSPGAGYRFRNALTSFTSADVNDSSGSVWQSLPCYTDSDGDGYGATGSNPATDSGASCPSGFSSSSIAIDCLDSDADVFQNITNLADDTDKDRWYTGSLATRCVGAKTSFWYSDAAAVDKWISSSDNLGTSDCSTADVLKWRNRYLDSDSDTYGVGSLVCVGNDAGYADNNNDCYDSNSNANPGQTSYFTTDRGDGSFDYNCNSATNKHAHCENPNVSSCTFAVPSTVCGATLYNEVTVPGAGTYVACGAGRPRARINIGQAPIPCDFLGFISYGVGTHTIGSPGGQDFVDSCSGPVPNLSLDCGCR